MTKFGAILLCFVGVSGLGFAQVRSYARMETRTQDPRIWMDRGRLGSEAAVPGTPSNWSGMLVDAGCKNRSADNLQAPPTETLALQTTTLPTNSNMNPPKDGATAIKVDPAILANERQGIMAHLEPDLVNRQPDASCAVTGATKAFALLLPNGLMLNLDPGGNTYALESFQSSAKGADVISGVARGFKPTAYVKARRWGDTLFVDSLQIRP